MATVVSVTPTNNPEIDGLLGGTAWAGTVTYSFPNSSSSYTAGYGQGEPEGASFAPLPAEMQYAVGYAIALIASYTNIAVQFAGTGAADIMVAQSVVVNPTSWAYLPDSQYSEGGDAWFGTDYDFSQAALGNYYFQSALHELGHSFGLKHSYAEMPGDAAVPVAHDSSEYTVMGYRSYAGADILAGLTAEEYGFAQSYMPNDILALQTMYGANYSTHSENTVYSWSPTTGQQFINGVAQLAPGGGAGGATNRIFETVWDGNGIDTYDMSNYTTGVTINLNPGASSITSTTQLVNLGDGHFASGNIYNSYLFNNDPRSLIENAIGGSGNDTLIANDRNCTLTGGGGDDTLTGGAGIDRLVGGTGVDTMSGGGGADTFVFAFGDSSAASGQHDRINGFVASVDRIDLSGIDAIAASGANDLFRFLGTSAFDGTAGTLNYFFDSARGVTVVQGDTNGDRVADFAIDLSGNVVLSIADFIGAVAGSNPVVIEGFGSTQLTRVESNYYLYNGGSGLSIKYAGAAIVQGQFGNWTPIGAEQTASGYNIVLKLGTADQYLIWSTDSSGNYITNTAVLSGTDSMLTSLENSFHQDLNGNGIIGATGTMIEAFGSTQLARISNSFYLNHDGSGPSLKYAGTAIVQGQFGNWTPISAEQTANGYLVVMKLGTTDQYTIWTTESTGNYLSNGAVVAGSDSTLTSLESSFHQDLNGDGFMPGSTTIEAFAATQLAQMAGNYYLYTGGSGVTIKYAGSPITQGQFGSWTLIGAEQTASGYNVVLKFGNADQYTIWSVDSSGNYLSNGAIVTGSDSTLTALEASFQQDLNGDGVVPGTTVIEAAGSTQLTQIGSSYYLSAGGSGLTIKYAGSPIAPGQFGIWTPIGAEHTASGYTVVMKFGTADQFTIWSTDNNGNYLSNGAVVAGSDSNLTMLEASFQQDLNRDGTISPAAATITASSAMSAGQPATPLHNAVHFISEQESGGWHFASISPSGGFGISGPEGFSLGNAGGELLAQLLREAQLNPALTTDGTRESFESHHNDLAKILAGGLHADYLISH